MEVGLRGNRAVLLQQFISQGDHTLRPGFEFWITGTANLWLPATSPSDSKIVINNSTANALTITANGGTPILGVARSSGTALPGGDRVRILPGQQASFVMGDRGWIAQGCEPPVLTFTYNGTPLASNASNPNSASDLFHWLGIQAGGGTWVNPAGTSWLGAAASSTHTAPYNSPPSVLSDRAAPSSAIAAIAHTAQVANSWFGWQLPVGYRFRPTGVLILTRGDNNGQYPRAFTIRVADGSTLTSGTAVNSWTAAQVFTNQTQIGGLSTYHFVSISTTQSGRQFAFEQQQNSTSDLWLTAQEFCWFGELFLS